MIDHNYEVKTTRAEWNQLQLRLSELTAEQEKLPKLIERIIKACIQAVDKTVVWTDPEARRAVKKVIRKAVEGAVKR